MSDGVLYCTYIEINIFNPNSNTDHQIINLVVSNKAKSAVCSKPSDIVANDDQNVSNL